MDRKEFKEKLGKAAVSVACKDYNSAVVSLTEVRLLANADQIKFVDMILNRALEAEALNHFVEACPENEEKGEALLLLRKQLIQLLCNKATRKKV